MPAAARCDLNTNTIKPARTMPALGTSRHTRNSTSAALVGPGPVYGLKGGPGGDTETQRQKQRQNRESERVGRWERDGRRGAGDGRQGTGDGSRD